MATDELTLTAIGLTAAEERAYRSLVRRRRGSPADVSQDTGITAAQAREALEALRTQGFSPRFR